MLYRKAPEIAGHRIGRLPDPGTNTFAIHAGRTVGEDQRNFATGLRNPLDGLIGKGRIKIIGILIRWRSICLRQRSGTHHTYPKGRDCASAREHGAAHLNAARLLPAHEFARDR